MQETSAEAFREYRESGELGEAQRAVLRALRSAPRPVTGAEIAEHMNLKGAWKRLSELERHGKAEKVGTRRCSISGKKASAWIASEGRRVPSVLPRD